jgi:hypothetical protein
VSGSGCKEILEMLSTKENKKVELKNDFANIGTNLLINSEKARWLGNSHFVFIKDK